MLMNNNASLNINAQQLSSGATYRLIRLLGGRQYELQSFVKKDGEQVINVVEKDDDKIHGMQSLNGFINSFNYDPESNMEAAMACAVDRYRESNLQLEKDSNFKLLCFAYAVASGQNRDNCLKFVDSLNRPEITALMVEVAKTAYGENTRLIDPSSM